VQAWKRVALGRLRLKCAILFRFPEGTGTEPANRTLAELQYFYTCREHPKPDRVVEKSGNSLRQPDARGASIGPQNSLDSSPDPPSRMASEELVVAGRIVALWH
jgi:hypothetical protein